MNKGKQSTATELAADILKFIDGSATVLDTDDITTFSLADPALESVRCAVLDILWRRRWTEQNPWCDDQGIADLRLIYADLLK